MFFSKTSKQCFRCQEVKSVEDFYRDCRSKDKRRASCKTCEESHRKPVKSSKTPVAGGVAEEKEAGLRSEKKASDLLPETRNEYSSVKDLDRIRNKHQKFITLCVETTGKARLQIFADEVIVYKGESVEEVLRMALA